VAARSDPSVVERDGGGSMPPRWSLAPVGDPWTHCEFRP
jgi:hypothetical protein